MYTLPVFNLLYRGWYYPLGPLDGDPDFSGAPCQLYVPSRMQGIEQYRTAGLSYEPPLILRVPKEESRNNSGNIIAVDLLAGRFFALMYSYPIHLGFVNEYTAWLLRECQIDGTPLPLPPGWPP